MERNLLKIYTKKQLRDIFKIYAKPFISGEFMEVVRRFEMDNKYYEVGDILFITKGNFSKVGAIILNRYLDQHNDIIDIEYLKRKHEELSNLLDKRCWWLYHEYLYCLKPCVQSNFLYKRIEGVENEKT
nr:MAG TPA: hypothetical protein [Caudoviricetes sp.]